MKARFTKKWVLGLSAALGLSMALVDTVSAAASLTSGSDPSATLTGGARFRNFNSGGGKEVWVGPAPLADVTSAQADVVWGAGAFSKCVQLSYDGTGTLTAKVANAATPCSFTSSLATASKTGLNLGTMNYVEITVTRNTQTTSIALNGLKVNSDSVGNLSAPTGTTKWKVTGADLTAGFTITGTLASNSTTGGGDSNSVQIDVGYVAPEDSEGPVTSSVAVTPSPVLLNGEGTVTAVVDDTTTGGSTIQSADYSLNGDPDYPMGAQDGAFDEVSEDVTAAFTAMQLGLNEVCVHGTDSLGNVGNDTCQSFLVTYKFDGFYSPIDKDFMNVVKAGQAIPAKWRLTDANDIPIDDPASFAGLYSYDITCNDYQGDPKSSVEEIAAGSSGLQYNGDGYWQFNWKTPKSYVNTCRAMYVVFDSGATSPVVKFQFMR